MRFAIIALCLLMLSGCVKPYVGKSVSMSNPIVCLTPSFPTECYLEVYEDMIPEFTITKLDDKGNYFIEGTFDPTKGSAKSFTHLSTINSTFRILFINNGKIFDSKVINVIHIDLDHKLPFNLKYNSKGETIEGVSIAYNISVVG